jgi:hypothetical protein
MYAATLSASTEATGLVRRERLLEIGKTDYLVRRNDVILDNYRDKCIEGIETDTYRSRRCSDATFKFVPGKNWRHTVP